MWRHPSDWGLIWVVVAIAYPSAVATLWHTDLRRSLPVVSVASLVSAGLCGLVAEHAGLLVLFVLPFVPLLAMIGCARRFALEPRS